MKKKNIFVFILSAVALFLEVLPYGAVLVFAEPTGEGSRHLYSYFDLVPFGYANFAPLICAILTVIIFILSAICLFFGAKNLLGTIFGLSLAATLISVAPLILFGARFFSIVGGAISVLLAAVCLISFAERRKTYD